MLPERLARRLSASAFKSRGTPEGRLGIWLLGHREYVGGLWDEMGRLQFDFLVNAGLRPSDVLLDVGCGPLRAGIHLIPYLDPGHYLGIDKERRLIDLGLRKELDRRLLRERSPEFVVSDEFEFTRFSRRPNVAIAQSLFTHLVSEDIDKCFRNLRAFVLTGTRFYASYWVGVLPQPSASRQSHSQRLFFYSRSAMEAFGQNNGWVANYIGDWGHPRRQVLVAYTAT